LQTLPTFLCTTTTCNLHFDAGTLFQLYEHVLPYCCMRCQLPQYVHMHSAATVWNNTKACYRDVYFPWKNFLYVASFELFLSSWGIRSRTEFEMNENLQMWKRGNIQTI
jgi:hypothetical protein